MSEVFERSAQHYASIVAWVNATLASESGLEISHFTEVFENGSSEQIFWSLLQKIDPDFVVDCESNGKWSEDIDLTVKKSLLHSRVADLLEITPKDAEYDERDEQSLADFFQLLLGCAVQCDNKENHISKIMGLDPTHQQCIAMEIDFVLIKCAKLKEIRINSSHSMQSPSSAPGGLGPANKSYIKVTPKPSPFNLKNMDTEARAQLGPKLKRALRLNEALRAENEQLHDENKELLQKLEKQSVEKDEERDEKREQEKKEMHEAAMQEMKEKETEMKMIMEEKENIIKELKGRIEKLTSETSKHRLVRDEIEVMRSQVKELGKCQQLNAKLREKLDIANGYKKQLDESQAKNAELLRDSVKLEKQSKLLIQCKKDLDSCKDSLTKSEMRNSELELILKDKEQVLLDLKEECNEMRESQLQANIENAALQNDLKYLNEEQNTNGESELDAVGVLGSGMSELNPDVRERLETLEAENKALKEASSAQGEDNLRHLKLTLENMTRLKEGLETKLHESTRNNQKLSASLEDTVQDLNSTKDALVKSNQSLQEMEQECKRLESCRVQLEKDCAELSATSKDLGDVICEKDESIETLNAEISSLAQKLNHLESALQVESEKNLELQRQIEIKECDYAQLVEAKEQEKAASDQASTHMNEEISLKKEKICELEEQLRELADQNEQALQDFEIKHVAVSFTEKMINEVVVESMSRSNETKMQEQKTYFEQAMKQMTLKYENEAEKIRNEYDDKLEEMNIHAATLSEELNILNDESTGLKAHAHNLRGNVKDSMQVIAEKNAELEEFKLLKEQLELKLEEKENKVAMAKAEIEEITNISTALKRELEEIEKKVRYSETEMQEERQQVSEYKVKLEDVNMELLEERTKAENLSSELQRSEETCHNTQSQIEHGRTLMTNLEKNLSEVQLEKESLGEELTRTRSTVEQQHAQILQLRRQFKSLQLQRSSQSSARSDGSQERVSELTKEVNRLLSEINKLSERNMQLEKEISMDKSDDRHRAYSDYGDDGNGENRGLAELIRSYEAQLRVHVEENRTLSLAKTNELTLRHEMEHKVQRLQSDNEELKGTIVSLQLQVERTRNRYAKLQKQQEGNQNQQDKGQKAVIDQEKENQDSNQNLAIDTPKYNRTRGKKETSINEENGPNGVPPSLQGNLMSAENLDDVDSPSKCNQS